MTRHTMNCPEVGVCNASYHGRIMNNKHVTLRKYFSETDSTWQARCIPSRSMYMSVKLNVCHRRVHCW